jgi:hypothetical protein
MKIIKFGVFAVLFLLWISVGNPQAASAPSRWGFAWAHSADSAKNVPYPPSATYAYNSSGGAISITRTAKGLYTVKFSGLGANSSGSGVGGNVQVTGYDNNAYVAKVRSWSSLGADFVVYVRVQSKAKGKPTNGRFTILVMAP